jgi:hypothetical protein
MSVNNNNKNDTKFFFFFSSTPKIAKLRLIVITIGIIGFLSIVISNPQLNTNAQLQQDQSNPNPAQIASSATAINATKVNLKVEGLSIGKSPTGVVEVTGTIHNNSTVNVEDIRLDAEYFDSNNVLIRNTTKILSTYSLVKPGESLPFDLLDIVSFASVKNYIVKAYGDKAK